MEPIKEPILRLDRISKIYGQFRAVDGISLEIRQGEIFSLLGPSGCGKSTTLRMIAGLDSPDGGEIKLKNAVLYSAERGIFVASQKRNMGMVFQSYAIWPHLTVFETVAYPLTIRKVDKAAITERVMDILRLVGLQGYEDRYSPMLSGGQQQRVALARALVYEPDVLLLDEPFSNLDARLREQMRLELKLLQRRVGVSVILVTHDQLEALSLSDRIAVMNAGRIEQLGTPQELYEMPASPFVRDFVGSSLQITGRLISVENGMAQVEVADGKRLSGQNRIVGAKVGDDVLLSVRPEAVTTTEDTSSSDCVGASIRALLYVGDRYDCVLDVGGMEVRTFLTRFPGSPDYREGQRIGLMLPPGSVTVWPR